MEKETVVVDKQGRIYLPKKMKEEVGSKFFVVRIDKELLLVPVPLNPVKELERIGKSLPRKSVSKFRKEILEGTSKAI